MRLTLRVLIVGAFAMTFAVALRAAEKANGAGLYKQNCSMCHGVDGKGYSALKTPDFTDSKWQASMSDKEMVEVVKNGRKGTAMPAFSDRLKENEIQALTAFVRSLAPKGKKNHQDKK